MLEKTDIQLERDPDRAMHAGDAAHAREQRIAAIVHICEGAARPRLRFEQEPSEGLGDAAHGLGPSRADGRGVGGIAVGLGNLDGAIDERPLQRFQMRHGTGDPGACSTIHALPYTQLPFTLARRAHFGPLPVAAGWSHKSSKTPR
jgi:hypothetical protein